MTTHDIAGSLHIGPIIRKYRRWSNAELSARLDDSIATTRQLTPWITTCGCWQEADVCVG